MCVCVCLCLCACMCVCMVYACVCSYVLVYLCMCTCVYVCVCQPPHGRHGNTSFVRLMMWLISGSTSVPEMWWRPGEVRVPRVCLASQQRGFIMHTHHIMHEAVLAPGPGHLNQVSAIVCDPPTLLPGLNSILVNRLLSIPWLGG